MNAPSNVDIYTLDAAKIDQITFPETILNRQIHPQSVKNYAIAIRRNQRQWSASTKGRSEVNHSGQKPHAQKGTGRARQGYLGAPQYKGGGVVFGPKPKFDQHVRINKRERRAAIHHLLGDKQREGQLIGLRVQEFSTPKTSRVSRFLQSLNWNHRTLFVMPNQQCVISEKDQELVQSNWIAFTKSMRNLARVNSVQLINLNALDLLSAKSVVFEETALRELLSLKESPDV